MKRGLGKGLESIFADNFVDDQIVSSSANQVVQELRISDVEPKKGQPRQYFDNESLLELADSISKHGLFQPILVRESGGGFYEIIAGERRWRASKMAGLTTIPAIIMQADELKAAQIAIIENIQREDLNPYEEANAYSSLMQQFGLTQEEVSSQVGKSRSAIANTMRLLDLPEEVLEMLKSGDISAGHARTLLGLKNKDIIEDVAHKILIKSLSVRDVEALVKRLNREYELSFLKTEKDEEEELLQVDYIKDLEKKAMVLTGKRVRISAKGKTKIVQIEYVDNEDLEEILVKICGNAIKNG